MKIEDIKAGRELDVLVAEKVMNDKGITYYAILTKYGKEISQAATTFHADGLMRSLFGASRYEKRIRYIPYSTDIAAAWQVVEKMQKKYVINIEVDCENIWVEIWRDSTDEPSNYKQVADESADTAPLAICLAALKAIE